LHARDAARTGQTIDTSIDHQANLARWGAKWCTSPREAHTCDLVDQSNDIWKDHCHYISSRLSFRVLYGTMKGDCDRAEQGYAKVAGLISSFPELANFRRFQTLNLQNLLYMQAEITHLESDLKELATEDVRSGKNLDHHHDWWSLAHDDSESAREQWTLIQKIREKLEMYSKYAVFQVYTAISMVFKS
jgi:hypothetical protein